jgi:hypothetical protein
MTLQEAKAILERRGFQIQIINRELKFSGAEESHAITDIEEAIKNNPDGEESALEELMTNMGFDIDVRNNTLWAEHKY